MHDEESEGYYYNPDARWDWFSIGDRWVGLIRIKNKEEGIFTRSNPIITKY